MDENKNSEATTKQVEQITEQKPSKWHYLFIVLGILQIIGVVVFFLIMIGLSQEATSGASGTEYVALALFATLVPAVAFVALINVIGLPIYMIKHKLRSAGLTFSIVSLIISIILVLIGAFTLYQITVSAPNLLGSY